MMMNSTTMAAMAMRIGISIMIFLQIVVIRSI
jgi:hypothetical protein